MFAVGALASIGLATVGAPTADAVGCTITGTGAGETINGTSGNDVICGLGGNDTIHGLGGDDAIYGDAGNDTIYGDAGNDYLQGDDDNDIIYGDDGNDELVGFFGHDELHGGADDDVFQGSGTSGLGSGDDDLYGDGGADYFLDFDGAGQTIDGGTGVDKFGANSVSTYSYAINLTTGAGNYGTAATYTFVDTEVILTGGQADTLIGSAANEEFYAGLGADTIDGGGGADIINGQDGRDTADYSSRTQPVTVTLAGGAANDGESGELDDLAGIEIVQGSTVGDSLTGGNGGDDLYGNDGADTLSGGNGNDELYGGAGTDVLSGGSNNDYLDGGADSGDSGDGGADTPMTTGDTCTTATETRTNCEIII